MIACNRPICAGSSKPTSACYRLLFKINALHATGRSNFLPPPTPMCRVEGEGRRWGANREIARVSSISRSLTPRFRSATIILSRERGEGKNEASFHDPVATLDNARIDDQPSQQKSWETKRLCRETNSTMYACVRFGSLCLFYHLSWKIRERKVNFCRGRDVKLIRRGCVESIMVLDRCLVDFW